ncbi:hypothetical protein O6H91_20G055700 [Diphasiastrum complanatum]|uniref:Uncharacterized protein n=1 Tax=Diphasiastrum complanatum TaxID=34168 RepID=A0ACC2AQN9_DIPCM|nr:hypothetical protein O6H91_20G055700 [Diphasiastrum complanatum]
MGFTSFSGRVLFSSIFILAAWQQINDFDHDGGNFLKELEPKFSIFKQHVASNLGFEIPNFELKYLLVAAIALEGIGAILFTFGSTLGAYILLLFLTAVTPIMHDFYNFDLSSPEYSNEFLLFLKNLSLVGSLLYYVGMKNSYALKLKRRQGKLKAN